MGYLVGQHDLPQILRVFKVGAYTAESVIDRALELRGGAVNRDFSPSLEVEKPASAQVRPTLLIDIASVSEPGERLWYA